MNLNIFRVKNKALVESGLHYVTIHSFRHSHASMLIDRNKLSVQDIAHRLGHSNPNITLGIYSHFFNKENNKISDVIDENSNNIVKMILDIKKSP